MPSAYEFSPMNLIRAIELAKTIERICFLNILLILSVDHALNIF